ncbi:MAG: ATP-grasp domain-containing protein [Dehalococcoidales bacterium]|nr:ATP-grasp domain-containing protein [Dehalococcoidales bacterium]
MKIGLSYDLKTEVNSRDESAPDALEEYDSSETIEIIEKALSEQGNDIVLLGGGNRFFSAVGGAGVDIVFNIAEGRGNYRSREAQVPAILEMLDIPYTGSDPETLAICLDKPVTKKLVGLEGISTPEWRLIDETKKTETVNWDGFTFPAIVKPAFEGSSKGIHNSALVHDVQSACAEIKSQQVTYHQPVMIEEFVDGDEVTVGIIGNLNPQIVGIMQIVPRKKPEHFVYSLEVKRDWENLVDYECPARLAAGTINLIEEFSLKAFRTLDCRDFSRIDFRIDENGRPYFIEINPLPGLGTYSDLIIMGKLLGRPHEEIIYSVFQASLERYPELKCR